ncbi:M12 family metallo-peptidase [Sabulicella glaciei]|uniref:Zinc-dependent metalloprotease n=1 Tax=Sabulicella glaciei TaxID=2984948 RepID=A0ABT3NZW0_9PROT|nr:M12 family metallo-peptidase [Roseococcus sp. MDT2-1-1]MCW8087688.1 zinc-dependent metalloprotease [Roseococcus sp. MDT2-1-1]
MFSKMHSLMIVALLSSGAAFAQPGDVNMLPSARRADLNDEQARRLQQIESQPSSRRTEVVIATDEFLSRLQSSSQVQIRPFNERMIALGGTADSAASNFSWNGAAEPAPPSAGANTAGSSDSVLIIQGDSVTGTIDLGDSFIEIRPLGRGLHALTEVDRATFPPEHPPSFRSRAGQTRDAPSIPLKDLNDNRVTDISVVVAYTNQVAERVDDVRSLVALAIAQSNRSYVNSGVNIRLVLAGDPIHLNYNESGSFDVDLDAFALRGDGKIDEIHSLRDTRAADIAVLLVNNRSYCGLARDIEVGADAAFALVNFDCATRQYSFAHEIGHLQGARHNPEADSAPGYAHGYTDEVRRRRTIMGYPCNSSPLCPRELQWARPTEWGNAERSHDARRLNETADYVSSFRGNPNMSDSPGR